MHPPRKSRQGEIFFPLVLIFIIGEFFITQTDATFYIEVTDKTPKTVKISLYECSASKNLRDLQRLPSQLPTSPTRDTPETPTISETPPNTDDVVCNEVTDGQKKKNIYSMALFYLVPSVALEGGKRLYMPSKSRKNSRFSSQERPYSILLGVTIFGKGPYDYPALVDATDSEEALNILQDKCTDTQLVDNFLDSENLNQFVQYLGVANFHSLKHPNDELIEQIKLYGRVVRNVITIYTRDFRLARKNKVDKETQMKVHGNVRSVIGLLNQKMLDPCFILSLPGAWGQKKADAYKEAQAQCKSNCIFLAVGFSTNRVSTSDCRPLVSGICDMFRCWCERTHRLGEKWPPGFVTMAKCSNQLRRGIAKSSTNGWAGVSLASLRKNFGGKSGKRTSSSKSFDRLPSQKET